MQAKFVLKLLMPLLAQVGRNDNQNAAPTLSPALQDDQPRLDGFSQPHLISQDHPFGQRVSTGKQGRIHLVRVQVDARVDQR